MKINGGDSIACREDVNKNHLQKNRRRLKKRSVKKRLTDCISLVASPSLFLSFSNTVYHLSSPMCTFASNNNSNSNSNSNNSQSLAMLAEIAEAVPLEQQQQEEEEQQQQQLEQSSCSPFKSLYLKQLVRQALQNYESNENNESNNNNNSSNSADKKDITPVKQQEESSSVSDSDSSSSCSSWSCCSNVQASPIPSTIIIPMEAPTTCSINDDDNMMMMKKRKKNTINKKRSILKKTQRPHLQRSTWSNCKTTALEWQEFVLSNEQQQPPTHTTSIIRLPEVKALYKNPTWFHQVVREFASTFQAAKTPRTQAAVINQVLSEIAQHKASLWVPTTWNKQDLLNHLKRILKIQAANMTWSRAQDVVLPANTNNSNDNTKRSNPTFWNELIQQHCQPYQQAQTAQERQAVVQDVLQVFRTGCRLVVPKGWNDTHIAHHVHELLASCGRVQRPRQVSPSFAVKMESGGSCKRKAMPYCPLPHYNYYTAATRLEPPLLPQVLPRPTPSGGPYSDLVRNDNNNKKRRKTNSSKAVPVAQPVLSMPPAPYWPACYYYPPTCWAPAAAATTTTLPARPDACASNTAAI